MVAYWPPLTYIHVKRKKTIQKPVDHIAPEGQAQHVVGKPVLAAVVPQAEDGGGSRQQQLQGREAELQALLPTARHGGCLGHISTAQHML